MLHCRKKQAITAKRSISCRCVISVVDCCNSYVFYGNWLVQCTCSICSTLCLQNTVCDKITLTFCSCYVTFEMNNLTILWCVVRSQRRKERIGLVCQNGTKRFSGPQMIRRWRNDFACIHQACLTRIDSSSTRRRRILPLALPVHDDIVVSKHLEPLRTSFVWFGQWHLVFFHLSIETDVPFIL